MIEFPFEGWMHIFGWVGYLLQKRLDETFLVTIFVGGLNRVCEDTVDLFILGRRNLVE